MVHENYRVYHIPFGLAHFTSVHQKPSMTEDLLRQLHVQCHEHDGPVDGMESQDVLSDEMHIRRPVLLEEVIFFTSVSQSGDVVGKRINPYIDHMSLIKGHRDAPVEAGSGDAKVCKPWSQEVIEHFILSGFRLDEMRIVFYMLDEPVRIFAHLEEVGFFLGFFHCSSAVRTFAVHQL